jgi:hypothetical protein
MNPNIPMPDQSGDTEQDASGYEKCEQDIEALKQWAQQVGDKIGVPFTPSGDDGQDALSDSLASTKPFGAGTGMSNS